MERYISIIKGHFANLPHKNGTKSAWVKIRQTLLAIAFSLIIASIMIASKGVSPIVFFQQLTKGAFLNQDATERTWVVISIYITAGAAIIAGFKAGLFNIGVGGQMAISGTAVVIVGSITNAHWSLLLLLAMVVAMASAAFIAILKAFFNIHEVVTAILFNYVLLYLAQYFLNVSNDWSYMNGVGTVIKDHSPHSLLRLNTDLGASGGTHILALLISLMIVTIFALIFKFTTLGYSLKGNGENPDAAKYAGINVVKQTIIGMSLSGIAAGALGAIFYLGYNNMSLSYTDVGSLPSIGFEGISVALIAQNSFLGLLPAAFFWGTLTSGAAYTEIVIPAVPKEVVLLINGFVIYSIAISIVFIKFKPFKLMTNLWFAFRDKGIKKETSKAWKALGVQRQVLKEMNNKLKKEQVKLDKNKAKIELLKYEIAMIKKKIKADKSLLRKDKKHKIDYVKEVKLAYKNKAQKILKDYQNNKAAQLNTISLEGSTVWDKTLSYLNIGTSSVQLAYKYFLFGIHVGLVLSTIRKAHLLREIKFDEKFEKEYAVIVEKTEEIKTLIEKSTKSKAKMNRTTIRDSKTIIKSEYVERFHKLLDKSRNKSVIGRIWQRIALRRTISDKYVALRREANLDLKDQLDALKDKAKKQDLVKKCVTKIKTLDSQEKSELKKNVYSIKLFKKGGK